MRKKTSSNTTDNTMWLKNAIQEGLDSGRAIDFDPEKHLAELKARKISKRPE